MLAVVHQDIDQRMANFTRRAERARMESAAPDGSATSERSVERAPEPYQQAHHPSRKRLLVEGLDDQVDVVGLNRELHHAKPRAGGAGERLPQAAKQTWHPQTR